MPLFINIRERRKTTTKRVKRKDIVQNEKSKSEPKPTFTYNSQFIISEVYTTGGEL